MGNKLEKRTTDLAIVFGVPLSAALWWLYIRLRTEADLGYVTSELGLWYNVPITTIFIITGLELVFSTADHWRRGQFHENFNYWLIWTLGFCQLYLRLITESINVSGHMTWLTLLVTQAILRKFPKWFIAVVVLAWLDAAYFNFYLFVSSSSGINGVVLGMVLSGLLILLERVFKKKRLVVE